MFCNLCTAGTSKVRPFRGICLHLTNAHGLSGRQVTSILDQVENEGTMEEMDTGELQDIENVELEELDTGDLEEETRKRKARDEVVNPVSSPNKK